MAACPEIRDHVVDLRHVPAADLAPLLNEEVAAWRDSLDWDLRPAADLVRRHVETQSLSGFALLQGTQPIGYSYYVRDGRKGLLGDLYVLAQERTQERENALLEAALDALWRSPGVERVEAQLLLFGATRLSSDDGALRCAGGQARSPLPYAQWLRTYPRQYLEIPASSAARFAARQPAGIVIAPWSEARQDDSARLVAAAYRGHIDSDINDQYRSPAGARRFLNNIVQYPGCGTFFAPASFMALDQHALCGISLASRIAEHTGHITQICVAPSHRGRGIGYALARSSLLALAAHGCDRVSLTVTTANENAIRLYRQMGFTLRREFAACVWNS